MPLQNFEEQKIKSLQKENADSRMTKWRQNKKNIMESNKIDMWLAMNSSMLPTAKIPFLKQQLESLDESKLIYLQSVDFKNPTTILIISILVGSLGIDRFMLGDAGMGVLKLLTCGGAYIWWIVDMINAQDRTKEYNFNKLREALRMQGVAI